jgi:hypothetical protein
MSAAIDGIRVAEAVALAVTGGEMRLRASASAHLESAEDPPSWRTAT